MLCKYVLFACFATILLYAESNDILMMNRRRLSINTWSVLNGVNLPRADMNQAAGYDNKSNCIWILGGYNYPQQLLSFNLNNNTISDYGPTYLEGQIQEIKGVSQYYTQNNQILYIIDSVDSTILRFSLSPPNQFIMAVNDNIPVNPAYYGCISAINNFIIIAGGYPAQIDIKTVQIYDIDRGIWLNQVPSMIYARKRHSCSIHEQTQFFYAFGGHNDADGYLSSIEKLFIGNLPSMSVWIELNDTLTKKKGYQRSVVDGEFIYIIGGRDNNNNILSDVDVLDVFSENVSFHSHLENDERSGAVIMVHGIIYVIGGKNNAAMNTIQYYNLTSPTTNPTVNPSSYPTFNPSSYPTMSPSTIPTRNPTMNPIATSIPTTENPSTFNLTTFKPTTLSSTVTITSLSSMATTTTITDGPTAVTNDGAVQSTLNSNDLDPYVDEKEPQNVVIIVLIIIIIIVGVIILCIMIIAMVLSKWKKRRMTKQCEDEAIIKQKIGEIELAKKRANVIINNNDDLEISNGDKVYEHDAQIVMEQTQNGLTNDGGSKKSIGVIDSDNQNRNNNESIEGNVDSNQDIEGMYEPHITRNDDHVTATEGMV